MNKNLLIKYTALSVLAVGTILIGLAVPADAQRKTPARPAQKPAVMPSAILNNEDTLTMIRRKGRLDVGVSLFLPWTMNDKDGNLMGFEVEVAKKLAEDIGVDLKLHPVGFVESLADLTTKRFDIVATGLYATPGRALTVNFSEPYSESRIEVIASRDVMKGEDDMEDFNKAEVTFGVVKGTAYAGFHDIHFSKSKLQLFDDEPALLSALTEGKISAAIVSSPTSEFLAKHSDKKVYRPFGNPLGRLGESFAIRKGDVDFLNFLNTWIRYYEQTGWLKKERSYWFDDTEWKDKL